MATFNIGPDGSVIVTVNGAALPLPNVTKFTYKQISEEAESRPLNGPPKRRKVPKGWEGTIDNDRANSGLDDFFVLEEGTYYAGGDSMNINILCTALDAVTRLPAQYRFDNATLYYEDGGTFEQGTKPVGQQVKFWASTMTKVA